ncbi:predicted protein [Nematostella vectensis]|uniref:EGF-like domain-containing protein n=1 Tax=Nematostella vectensis TaxID=45351 RepID=A7RVW6_NEMVE|nr:predicted protein [Nematostella vectensis]|eukprot:XP_001636583.1 predicted protein [Nematostella vectensis]
MEMEGKMCHAWCVTWRWELRYVKRDVWHGYGRYRRVCVRNTQMPRKDNVQQQKCHAKTTCNNKNATQRQRATTQMPRKDNVKQHKCHAKTTCNNTNVTQRQRATTQIPRKDNVQQHKCHAKTTCNNTNATQRQRATTQMPRKDNVQQHKCHAKTTCNNTKGGYNCTCVSALYGQIDPYNCTGKKLLNLLSPYTLGLVPKAHTLNDKTVTNNYSRAELSILRGGSQVASMTSRTTMIQQGFR